MHTVLMLAFSAVKDISYQGVAHIMQRSHPHRGHHFLLPNQAIGIWVTWSLAKRRQEEEGLVAKGKTFHHHFQTPL